MPEDSIVCTSVPGYGIPGGKKIYEWLREQLLGCVAVMRRAKRRQRGSRDSYRAPKY